MKTFFLFAAYVFTSSFGLYKMKGSSSVLGIDFLYGSVLYGAGFLLWLVILRSNPLSTAFPVAASSLIITTQIIGVVLLHEPVSLHKVAGLILILIGIVLIYYRA